MVLLYVKKKQRQEEAINIHSLFQPYKNFPL